jgi:hypothetical protein
VQIHLPDDDESASRLRFPRGRDPRVVDMKRWLYLTILALGLLVLALGGWVVQGVRWARPGRRYRRRLATA